jgi:hypothetical protein
VTVNLLLFPLFIWLFELAPFFEMVSGSITLSKLLYCTINSVFKLLLINYLLYFHFVGFGLCSLHCQAVLPFQVAQLCRQRCPPLADNGMAAWRSGGIYALPFKSALPAAVAPNRLLYAGIFNVECYNNLFSLNSFNCLIIS